MSLDNALGGVHHTELKHKVTGAHSPATGQAGPVTQTRTHPITYKRAVGKAGYSKESLERGHMRRLYAEKKGSRAHSTDDVTAQSTLRLVPLGGPSRHGDLNTSHSHCAGEDN